MLSVDLKLLAGALLAQSMAAHGRPIVYTAEAVAEFANRLKEASERAAALEQWPARELDQDSVVVVPGPKRLQ